MPAELKISDAPKDTPAVVNILTPVRLSKERFPEVAVCVMPDAIVRLPCTVAPPLMLISKAGLPVAPENEVFVPNLGILAVIV